MSVYLSQLLLPDGLRAVAVRAGRATRLVQNTETTRELALAAIEAGHGLRSEIVRRGTAGRVDLSQALAEGRMLLPLDHPDPAHLHMSGTGLTHLGSVAARDAMHRVPDPDSMTDSIRMFRMGLEGGKPLGGGIGSQPEWFYKGNGNAAVAPGAPLTAPPGALDAGEEPEIAGLYVIGPDGTPFRIGYALGNEFSDHVTERSNMLWLAHSKLRPASFGPEILLGALPARVEGLSRVRRNGKVVWEKPFLSGEANMSHSLANLEHHHFKYDLFRQPGDLHVHFFGTATLSFADGIRIRNGDRFEIESKSFGLPLHNPVRLRSGPATAPISVSKL